MRTIVLLLLLAGCATPPPPPSDGQVCYTKVIGQTRDGFLLEYHDCHPIEEFLGQQGDES